MTTIEKVITNDHGWLTITIKEGRRPHVIHVKESPEWAAFRDAFLSRFNEEAAS